MTDKDYAPLSAACVRALHDKLYEKRKAAALEIEKMVKEFNQNKNIPQIKKLLKVLGHDFTLSPNGNAKKGGLIGLAAMAVALGPDSSTYITELITPMLSCFHDNDSRVRYYACEALYNVLKVGRGSVLKHFPELFKLLSTIASDPEQHIKNASESLDRILKDIVTESTSYQLPDLVPLLRERVYANNSFARQFIISWISVLQNVPSMDLTIYLPEFLDGLFFILADNSDDIRNSCDILLNMFLTSIKQDPSRINFAAMINILIAHAQSKNPTLQLTAISWIKEFVQLSGKDMLPFTSGILLAILPCLSYENDKKNTKEMAKAVSYSLLRLISLENIQDENELNTDGILEVLIRSIEQGATTTKVASLAWLHHLHKKMPTQISKKLQESSPTLMNCLSDPSDEVVKNALVVLASLSSPTSPAGSDFFLKFITDFLQLVRTDKSLLEVRVPFILRQLCVLLNAEGIYRTLAKILIQEQDLAFCRNMIDCLHGILLTSGELAHLRNELQHLSTPESSALFVCLYETWCHNPVATVALCLLSQCYQHASLLIRSFADLDVTVEFLTEIDKLVQLLESPIFIALRLQLLDNNQPLIDSLYGILMLLPQTEAFHILSRRLQCIPKNFESKSSTWKETRPDVLKTDFNKLLKHFKQVQERHKIQREEIRSASLTNTVNQNI